MGKTKLTLEIDNSIGDLRAKHQITQQQLADEIGVTRVTVNTIENGNYNPSLELAFKIAIFFKTDIESVFKVRNKGRKS
ncbi:MAG: helix-turn-helix transcriptional regulator [Bdellovibrio sp.]|nr:helix-turn-helix transcriptional regulator [Bdellovibrio sp.]